MSLWGDVTGFVTGGVKTVVGTAERVLDAIKSLWSLLGGLTREVSEAWGEFYQALVYIGDALAQLASADYSAIKWLAERGLPGAVSYVFGQVVGWTEREVAGAIDALQTVILAFVRAVERVLVGVINDVKHLLAIVEHWAAAAFNFVEGAGAWLWNLVSHPERLVAWIIPVLIEPLLRWMVSESRGLVLWFLRQLKPLAVDFADVLEDVFRDLV